jgi:hypothetical protein
MYEISARRQMITGINEEGHFEAKLLLCVVFDPSISLGPLHQTGLSRNRRGSIHQRETFLASLNFKFSLYLSCQGKPAAGRIELAVDMKTGRSAVAPK